MALATRRERIVEAASRLFASRGYAETSLRDLADAAGCSRSSLNHDFATKDELLAAVAERLVTDIESILASLSLDLEADKDRESVIRAYLLALAAHRDASRVLLTDASARRTPIGQRVVEQQRLLVARLTGPRAPLRQQVRARCAVAITHLLVGELARVPAHRLRPPLLEAAIDTLVSIGGPSSPRAGSRLEDRPRLPVSRR